MACLLNASGRIELELNRFYSIGRAADCDIVVQDVMCSRRHARLGLGAVPQAIFIEDAGSTNGIFVDDERVVTRRHLKHGSRLRIGATAFLLSLSPSMEPEGDLLDTGTFAAEQLLVPNGIGEEIFRVARAQGMAADLAGRLNNFSAVELLQTIMHTHRSGTLHVVTEDGEAKLEVRDGEVRDARYRGLNGFDALLALARQTTGVFWLIEAHGPCVETIDEPASTLLFNLCRALDEGART